MALKLTDCLTLRIATVMIVLVAFNQLSCPESADWFDTRTTDLSSFSSELFAEI